MTKPVETHLFAAVQTNILGTRTDVIDIVHPVTGLGAYGGKTAEELAAQYGPITVMTFEQYDVIHSQEWRQGPQPTTEEDFTHALEVLPPEDWVQDSAGNTFKMSEHWSGNMTSIYARVNGQYYHLIDNAYLPHSEIVAMCQAYAAEQTKETA